MDILTFFTAVFAKTDNVAILILVVMLGGMVYLYVQQRKEEREDRRALLELVNKNTEALNGVKLALVALTGRVTV